jgi:hypothetical protein
VAGRSAGKVPEHREQNVLGFIVKEGIDVPYSISSRDRVQAGRASNDYNEMCLLHIC